MIITSRKLLLSKLSVEVTKQDQEEKSVDKKDWRRTPLASLLQSFLITFKVGKFF